MVRGNAFPSSVEGFTSVARTNLHEIASRLLSSIGDAAPDGRFEGKLRSLAAETGLNSVRSAEAIKLLEDLGRIEVVQRGRRGRDTVIDIRSTDPVSLEDARSRMQDRTRNRTGRINYEDIGRSVVERLLELGRDDALRSAQVEAFAMEAEQNRARVQELEAAVEESQAKETELRMRLRAAEEALERAEENMRKAFAPAGRAASTQSPAEIPDDETRAVLDILRSARG